MNDTNDSCIKQSEIANAIEQMPLDDFVKLMVVVSKRAEPPIIEQLEFQENDFPIAERIAKRLGYQQTAYTSTSGLWGLFCLRDNPAYSGGYHLFENIDPAKFDSNCRKCGGKWRDSVHNLRLNF